MTSAAAAPLVPVERLGCRGYDEVLALQMARRDAVLAGGEECLYLVEHLPVITIGRGGDERHVLDDALPIVRVNRGGDVTYHGPGQIVGYPILDLARRAMDVHRYLRALEGMLIDIAARFGVVAGRRPGFTGVWVGTNKLAAIGIGVRRWVTMHGFALNVADVRDAFRAIVPCGLAGTGVTSLAELSGRCPPRSDVEDAICEVFQARFGAGARASS